MRRRTKYDLARILYLAHYIRKRTGKRMIRRKGKAGQWEIMCKRKVEFKWNERKNDRKGGRACLEERNRRVDLDIFLLHHY